MTALAIVYLCALAAFVAGMCAGAGTFKGPAAALTFVSLVGSGIALSVAQLA